MIADTGLLRDKIERIITEKMKPRVATAFRMRHGLGYPGVYKFSEIATELGVSNGRVWQIYGQAWRIFKFHARKYNLPEFLKEET